MINLPYGILCLTETGIMNLRQLEAFNEVMLSGSVTQAARNLGRTQPAVSALIVGLERSVGYNLFERRRGRLHPVPEALYLQDQSASILEDLGKLRQSMQDVGRLQTGHLRIACLPVFGEILMPRLIASFVRDRENVSASLTSQSSERVYERMASQQFDIGLAEAIGNTPLVHQSETAMDCLCALPAGDPLAEKGVVTPADLAGRSMASFLSGHFIRSQVEQAFEAKQVDLKIRFEMQNAASQFAFVEDGLAWSVVSPMSAHYYDVTQPNNPKIVFRQFRPAIQYRIAVLTPAHAPVSQLAQAFAAQVAEEVKRIAGMAETSTQAPAAVARVRCAGE